MSLAERFKTERERLGLTQPRVAVLTGVGKTTVINWEKGQSSPTAAQLAALADAGMDVLYVITGERSSAQPAHDAAEQVLLDAYRRCSAEGRQHLIATAALLAAGVAPGPAPRAKAAATAANSPKRGAKVDAADKPSASAGEQVFHDQVGQVVKVSGNLEQKDFSFFSSKKDEK